MNALLAVVESPAAVHGGGGCGGAAVPQAAGHARNLQPLQPRGLHHPARQGKHNIRILSYYLKHYRCISIHKKSYFWKKYLRF